MFVYGQVYVNVLREIWVRNEAGTWSVPTPFLFLY